MRNSWTDERLDAFVALTDRRFDGLEQRFDTVEKRMDSGFNRVDADLRAVTARIDALQRSMLQTNAVIIAALIGLIATQL
jgi:hypothetical protein